MQQTYLLGILSRVSRLYLLTKFIMNLTNSASTFSPDTPWAKSFASTNSLSKQHIQSLWHFKTFFLWKIRQAIVETTLTPFVRVVLVSVIPRSCHLFTCWFQTALLLCITITTQFRLEDRTMVKKVNWIFHDNRSTNLYIMITKNKTLPTTTLYYKTCTKYFTVSIYLIALKYCLYINRRRSSLEAKKQFGSTFWNDF
jgi:hypothetical protein